jgi:hypothetical protein
MKYRVGDMFVSKIPYTSSKIGLIGLITREYESNGLRYEITFESNDGKKTKFTYTAEQLEYRYSEGYGWTYYPVVK